jgi:hypothetical protein
MDEVTVPAFADEESVEDPAAARDAHVQDADDDDRTATPEVSEDDAAAEESDDDNVEDVTPAAQKARSGSKVPPPASAQRELSSPDNSEDDEYYFFADLGRLMLEPASVAYIFARHAERERRAGLDVAAQVWATTKQLVGEAPPGDKLSAALAAANRRAYLVVMRGDRYFTLIHHLTILDVELRPREPIRGRLVAFEADVLYDGFPPRLVVLDAPPRELFEVLRPSLGSRNTVNGAYLHRAPSDKRFLGVRLPEDGGGNNPAATTRLIPIPMAWAAYFFDNPSFGVAVRRMRRLVDAIPRLEQIQFAPILDSLLLACYGDRVNERESYSVLSSEWDPVPMHQRTKAWMQKRWSDITSGDDIDVSGGEETIDSDDDRKMPARSASRPASPQLPPIRSRVRPAPSSSGTSPKRIRRTSAPTAAAARNGTAAMAATLPAPTATASTTAFTVADLGPLISELLKAQAESTMQLHQSLQTNMVANIQATSMALAATGQAKDKKLPDSKLRILQACSGLGDSPSFALSTFYADLDKNGITTENCGTGLRRLVVSVQGSANKVNVHISPKIVAAAKTCNFSNNDDRTFLGCTSGITPFAVPWRSAEAINDALADERYFNEATLKSPDDIRKHVMAGSFEAPTTLQGLTRVFTNYSRLLEVLFGPDCPHLLFVIELRDGLAEHERMLECTVTPTLMVHLLWKVHLDARQFFTACERWDIGNIIPISYLGKTVHELVADVNITATITCPVAQFLGPPAGAQKREPRENPRERPAVPTKQPTRNSAIPAICASVVQKFNRLHPSMDIASFVRKAGLRYAEVRMGGPGDCTTFSLLGRCKESCKFNHRVITITDERANGIKAALEKGLAKLAADAGPT